MVNDFRDEDIASWSKDCKVPDPNVRSRCRDEVNGCLMSSRLQTAVKGCLPSFEQRSISHRDHDCRYKLFGLCDVDHIELWFLASATCNAFVRVLQPPSFPGPTTTNMCFVYILRLSYPGPRMPLRLARLSSKTGFRASRKSTQRVPGSCWTCIVVSPCQAQLQWVWRRTCRNVICRGRLALLIPCAVHKGVMFAVDE